MSERGLRVPLIGNTSENGDFGEQTRCGELGFAIIF
jgi:hypothetical protein